VLFLVAAWLSAAPARAAGHGGAAAALVAQSPGEDVPEPDFEDEEDTDSTAVFESAPEPAPGKLPAGVTANPSRRDSTALADSTARPDSTGHVRSFGTRADSLRAFATRADSLRALGARADSLRAHRRTATPQTAAVPPKKPRNGILGLHPAAIVAALVVVHVLIVRWIAD
jgi:hypothetical protein